jgi:hypothetical protein
MGEGLVPPLPPPPATAPKAALPDEGVSRGAAPAASSARVGCAAAVVARVLLEAS